MQDKKAYLDNSLYLNSGKNKIISIKEEFMKSATPGVGKINILGYPNKHENEMLEWLYNVYGGNIIFNKPINVEGVRNPDLTWNYKLWDIKNATSKNSINKHIRYGIHQIEKNPGGLIIDVSESTLSSEDIIKEVNYRLRRSCKFRMKIILKINDDILDVFEN